MSVSIVLVSSNFPLGHLLVQWFTPASRPTRRVVVATRTSLKLLFELAGDVFVFGHDDGPKAECHHGEVNI